MVMEMSPTRTLLWTHAIEKIEGWETPENIAAFAVVEQPLLGEIDQTEYARKAESGVGQDATLT